MDLRWGGDDTDRIRALAQELVGLRPDIIFAITTPAIVALQRETRTIPIVFIRRKPRDRAMRRRGRRRPATQKLFFVDSPRDPSSAQRDGPLLKPNSKVRSI